MYFLSVGKGGIDGNSVSCSDALHWQWASVQIVLATGNNEFEINSCCGGIQHR